MLKLSRTGIGLLTAQYRSILKKCFILNMVAAGAMLYAGSAKAESYDFDISKVTNTSATDMQESLSKMGTEIGHSVDAPEQSLGILAYSGSDTLGKVLVSKDGLPSGTYGDGTRSWIVNNGLFASGYEYNETDGKLVAVGDSTAISNKHNTGAKDTSFAGGAVLNHSEQESDKASALMLVRNTVFENNSASYFGPLLDESAGGAIENIANYRDSLAGLDSLLDASDIHVTNNNIEASTFTNNFVMNYYRARGGAIYNNSEYAITTTGHEIIRGVINSAANTFSGNHAGNTDNFEADETVRKYVLGTEGGIEQDQITTWKNSDLNNGDRVYGMSDFAQGGAVFNNDTYNSNGNGFFANFAQGKYAEGGAVYNGAPYEDLGTSVTPTFTVSGNELYSNNYVVSYEAQNHEVEGDDGPYVGGHALGGAVYNAGDYIMLDDGQQKNFSTNYAKATDTAMGGAMYNSGNMEINRTIYTGNYAEMNGDATSTSVAAGGAIASQMAGNELALNVHNSSFIDNHISSFNLGFGGALYNNNASALTTVVDSNFTGNYIFVDEAYGGEVTALGGAIYNNADAGSVSRLVIKAENADVNISDNSIKAATNLSTTAQNYQGGAIYNGINGQLAISSSADRTLSLNNNGKMIYEGILGFVAKGGAIYNGATGTYSALATSTPYFLIDGNGGNIEMKGNLAGKGGAVYNAGKAEISVPENSVITMANNSAGTGGAIYNEGTLDVNGSGGGSLQFTENTAKDGGAIYNATDSTVNIELENTAGASFSENKATDGSGGAVYNANDFDLSFEGGTVSFNGNTATNSGGAVYNEGTFDVNSAGSGSLEFVENTAKDGGAIYNATDSTVNIELENTAGASFSANKATNGSGGAVYNANDFDLSFEDGTVSFNGNTATNSGGAVYNEGAFDVNSAETSSLQFTENTAKDGGAIYNATDSTVNIGLIIDAGASFIENEATDGSGGAVYNANDFDLSFEGGTVSFNGNTATNSGGAVYNEGTFDVNSAGSGSLEFVENTAKDGGAIYNATDSTVNIELENTAGASFSANKATDGSGGAVYNANDFDLSFEDGTVSFNGNTATNSGGAVYIEDDNLFINNENGNGSLEFVENEATKGGAIYVANNGSIEANIGGDATILFDGNISTDGEGGAIYNEENATIDVTLADTAELVFNTTSDDVYNLGTVTITGDSAAPQTLNLESVVLSTINPEATAVVLNSTFAGSGQYNISNTQLNLGSTGYINEEPEMVMTNNVVNMAEGSHIYLTSDDTLTNNNFDVASNSVLKYTDLVTDDTDFYLANTVYNAGKIEYYASTSDTDIHIAQAAVNSGIISAADGVLTNVHIDTLQSVAGNEIVINLDNDNLKADVVTIDNRIFNTTETPTKITFVDMANEDINEVNLEVDDRIYFAQTQVAQSLSDYGFSVNAENSDYEIKIGYEENDDVYDWYLYRYDEPVPPEPEHLDPEDLAYIDLPRSAVEQTRGIVFDVTRTKNNTMCRCYADNCNNRFCRQESAPAQSRLWIKPTYRKGTFDKPLETDFTLKGIEFGLDYLPTNDALIGVFGSYRDGEYENEGGKVGEKFYAPKGGSELEIKSYLAGLYFRKYFGNFYFLGAGYLGKQDVDIKTKKTDVKASTDGVNIGAQAELGYDIRTSNRSVITPSLRATYDYIKFDDLMDNKGKKAEFSTINDLELEAALKFEYQFNNEQQLPTTGYIKPSVIQTIENGGKVTINGNEFDDTLENETLGRIEVGADAELIENFSVGAFGNYTFGSDYKAWGVGGNVRYVW